MILNDEAFSILREKRKQNEEKTNLIDYSDDCESMEKYEKKLYRIPVVQNEQFDSIVKEIFLEYCIKIVLIVLLTLVALFIWVFWIDTHLISHTRGQSTIDKCEGINCQLQTCDRVKRFEVTGKLCMDLCYTNSINLPKCSNHLSRFSNSSNQFYSIADSELNYVCTSNLFHFTTQNIPDGIQMDEFRQLVFNKVFENINEPNTVEKIVDKIFLFTDVNNDLILNLAEAQTLWSMLNQKHSFYMLTMMGNSYIPKITDFCGSVLQIEEIKNNLNEKNNYSLLKSVFIENDNWRNIKIKHKLKIALGILEFFLDAASHNPNDDFSPETIYLCSSIESSFGFTFINEAKLINYDFLFSGKELKEKLRDKECSSDSDCFYSDQCTTTCDLNLRKCSHQLSFLQVTIFCEFFQKFIDSNSELKIQFEPLIKKCLKLKPFYLINQENNLNRIESESDEQVAFLKNRAYLNASMEYALTTNNLHDKIWEMIKLVNDPVKPKKKTQKQQNKT